MDLGQTEGIRSAKKTRCWVSSPQKNQLDRNFYILGKKVSRLKKVEKFYMVAFNFQFFYTMASKRNITLQTLTNFIQCSYFINYWWLNHNLTLSFSFLIPFSYVNSNQHPCKSDLDTFQEGTEHPQCSITTNFLFSRFKVATTS